MNTQYEIEALSLFCQTKDHSSDSIKTEAIDHYEEL